MKIILTVLLLTNLLVLANANAQNAESKTAPCVAATLDETIVENLQETLTLYELITKFEKGCFGGFTAMTYQFQGKSGKRIWFWLKNETIPAFNAMERARKLEDLAKIGVLMAVSVIEAGNKIIWPKSLIGKSEGEVIEEAYFKKYRDSSSAPEKSAP